MKLQLLLLLLLVGLVGCFESKPNSNKHKPDKPNLLPGDKPLSNVGRDTECGYKKNGTKKINFIPSAALWMPKYEFKVIESYSYHWLFQCMCA